MSLCDLPSWLCRNSLLSWVFFVYYFKVEPFPRSEPVPLQKGKKEQGSLCHSFSSPVKTGPEASCFRRMPNWTSLNRN
uniref:Uncharacterized protein n=1 Tax=Anguilla anguilla TaxID=7936 RepID=A0A0E9PU37_ANGAN